MPKMSPQELAAKWAQRTAAAGEAYKQGVMRTQSNPAQKAIAAQDRLLTNFTDSVTSGRWANALGKTTLQSWQQASVEKGAPALATAARVAQDKVARAEAVNGPIRESIVASLPPRGSLDDNINRAAEFARRMSEARKSR